MKRSIIKIDEEKCNGCGICIPNCHEGALQMIDGKARLISDLFCDGLGACIGHCPEGAITMEEREAEPYNETLVMEQMVKQGKNVVLAHLKHLKEHGADEYLNEAIAYIKKHKIDLDVTKQDRTQGQGAVHQEMMKAMNSGCGGGCPGSRAVSFDIDLDEVAEAGNGSDGAEARSELRQWPVQLHLLNPHAPYLKNADLVLAADCAAFSMGNFHSRFLKGKALAIACPKLDTNQESYLQKLAAMIRESKLNTITVVRMEVPCCGGLARLALQAAQIAGSKIPVKQAVISTRGEVLIEEWT